MSESSEVKNHAEEFVQHDKYGQEQGSEQEQAERDQANQQNQSGQDQGSQDQDSHYSQDQGVSGGGGQQQG